MFVKELSLYYNVPGTVNVSKIAAKNLGKILVFKGRKLAGTHEVDSIE